MNKTLKTLISLSVLLLAMTFVSCGNSLEGTWYIAESESDVKTLTLNEDKTFITDFGEGGTGEWTEVDNTIVLATANTSETLQISESEGETVLQYNRDKFYHDREAAKMEHMKSRQMKNVSIMMWWWC